MQLSTIFVSLFLATFCLARLENSCLPVSEAPPFFGSNKLSSFFKSSSVPSAEGSTARVRIIDANGFEGFQEGESQKVAVKLIIAPVDKNLKHDQNVGEGEPTGLLKIMTNEVDAMIDVCNSPGMIKYHKCFYTSSEDYHNLYIVMEPMESQTLHPLSTTKKTFFNLATYKNFRAHSAKTRFLVYYRLAEQLEHIHSKNWIHNDIKPRNIMFTTTVADDARIIDFGGATRDQEKLLVSTAAYQDLESTQNKIASQLNDIWAFGITIAEIEYGSLIGVDAHAYYSEKGYSGKNLYKMFYKIREQIINSFSGIEWVHRYGDCSFISLIKEMLRIKQSNRIGSMTEVKTWLGLLVSAFEQKLDEKLVLLQKDRICIHKKERLIRV